MIIDNVLKFFQICSSIATIIGVIGLFFTIKSYKDGKKIQSKNEDRQVIVTSIKVLEIFSRTIIPEMGVHEREVANAIPKNVEAAVKSINEELKKSGSTDKVTTEKLPKEMVDQIILVTKINSNLLKTFNNFEHVSVYINYGLVDDDLIYNAVHNNFCGFIDRNKDVFNELITDDVPFTNTRKLYNKWKSIHEESDYIDK
ncbi:DUF4760 domain-containing protein [Fructobacillus fructosus]|uniref:DUF4760 domain-containing protein n=1 Tax=Fructobacillus fructosus TaxID=1631 RepID=UPI002DA4D756|nr:unnamed protein product [Fructobacillus fructosus]CAK1236710.1 unnamed protein product [Fructobacillus fructosus]CAK1237996.1 unnamed protein product [Fructobacillus fructosus]